MDSKEKPVVVLRSAWLPTRQANGIQTVRMCEAFASLGLPVRLYYVPQPRLRADIAAYYNLRAPIDLKRLPRAVLPMRKHFTLNRRWSAVPSFAHAFLWCGWVTQIVSRTDALFYFVREPMLAWWLALRRLPTVLEIHDIPQGFERIFIRSAARQNSLRLLLAITEHMRIDLAGQLEVPAEKLLTLHDGIELDESSHSETKEIARQKLGLAADRNLIVYTGRLDAEKGVEVLARAAPMLRDVDIVIVGDGTLADGRLQRLIEEIDASNVSLVGFRPHSEARLFQKAADVLVLPHSMKYLHSAYYTSPLKLFEYMAAGAPIIAAKLPAIREVIKHGDNGWLVAPDDPSALAAGIRHVLRNKDLGAAMAAQAVRDVKNYTWQGRAGRIVEGVKLNGSDDVADKRASMAS
jgi:glycosyltransferase involved in cell wall biosynthesis